MKRIFAWIGAVGTRVRNFGRRQWMPLLVLGFVTAFLLLYLSDRIVVSIRPGELGVLWSRFGGGTVVHTVYREGLHLVWPFDHMYVYNSRKQRFQDSIDVLTVDGMTMHVEYSVRYFPNADLLPMLHQRVGPKYLDVIVKPEVRSVIRTIFGQYRPEEIYTTQRAIQERVSVMSKVKMEARFVSIDEVPIESIALPKKVTEAIESKLAMQQMNAEYDYRLAVATKEAERKLIEARGQRSANEVMSQSMTPAMLTWHGIQATQELVKSPNAKVIVLGAGKANVPLILGQ